MFWFHNNFVLNSIHYFQALLPMKLAVKPANNVDFHKVDMFGYSLCNKLEMESTHFLQELHIVLLSQLLCYYCQNCSELNLLILAQVLLKKILSQILYMNKISCLFTHTFMYLPIYHSNTQWYLWAAISEPTIPEGSSWPPRGTCSWNMGHGLYLLCAHAHV